MKWDTRIANDCGVLSGKASVSLGARYAGASPEEVPECIADAGRPRRFKLTRWRGRRSTVWLEHMRSERRAWIMPSGCIPPKGSGPRGLLGCLITVPCLSPSPPLLLSCHCPAQKSLDSTKSPSLGLRPSIVDLSDLVFCLSAWILCASQSGLLVSLFSQAFPHSVFCFLFLECHLPSSSFFPLLPSFQVPYVSSWSDSPFSKCRDHIRN